MTWHQNLLTEFVSREFNSTLLCILVLEILASLPVTSNDGPENIASAKGKGRIVDSRRVMGNLPSEGEEAVQ